MTACIKLVRKSECPVISSGGLVCTALLMPRAYLPFNNSVTEASYIDFMPSCQTHVLKVFVILFSYYNGFVQE
jgi:hypothetical protein